MYGDVPKAQLYTFDGSVWASVPRLGLIEKGYSDHDVDIRIVDLFKGENFSPSFLRINSKGTLPTLVVPIAETTSPEVATKFRALTDSKAILEFLDRQRSHQVLHAKAEVGATPAPVLSPATIEGKAECDALIQIVHDPKADPNMLFLGARTQEELEANRQGVPGIFCKNRDDALRAFKAEVLANASGSQGSDVNPRSAATIESLSAWYDNKLSSLSSLTAAHAGDASAGESHISATRDVWAGVASAISTLEKSIKGPYALGDQISLADIHLIAWLARVITVASGLPGANPKGEGEEIDNLEKALRHSVLGSHPTAGAGVGPKLRDYWRTVQTRPSFQEVYKDGLH